ncbi:MULTISPECIES: 3-oxo-tetronate kinase [Streptomyces]|uniref:3-oxo-tetronate kinase n=1 Tax=Streptomyces koelreuteriae TaxID=2838015 RepID=A0ABX8FJE9_9ACTN|nr:MULTISPECIES: 3-oxo-tetronate kinase [Streptomyces]QWB21250.1 four-carbon acid sugar kinase family protein [Streptomyces koelreuteriae]UUA04167.1 four-carbon acid sugar kinase family protein [Streptomyces koelreuteriae]UUA11793.1 four-carbon acid sugar kinase family protein [Streptomyces sp. CRCS-T-1]
MSIRLGCIADDFTGATDLANNLVRAGMRVVQLIDTPPADAEQAIDADAVVIALKSRTVPAADAVEASLRALAWLRSLGAEQVYFKYCSTFDSTPAGNIGPVTEALMDALGTDFTVATPAFPDNGRTIFKGHLFVGDVLLSDSGMRHHPLTPMTDSNLVSVLGAQTTREVGLVDHTVVADGVEAIRARVDALREDGFGLAIVDAVSNDDLVRLGAAVQGFPLVTAGSGLAIGLPANWGFEPSRAAAQLPPPAGHRAIVSGSVSTATNRQVLEYLSTGRPAFSVDPLRVAASEDVVEQALAFAESHLDDGPVLVYSTESADTVRTVQGRLGAAEAGELVERTLARIAQGLVARGVRRLVVAGGETSGAVVQALGVTGLRIGPQIDPGVPWCAAALPDGETLHITLKSGNFGGPDFFTRSFALLDEEAA